MRGRGSELPGGEIRYRVFQGYFTTQDRVREEDAREDLGERADFIQGLGSWGLLGPQLGLPEAPDPVLPFRDGSHHKPHSHLPFEHWAGQVADVIGPGIPSLTGALTGRGSEQNRHDVVAHG